MAHLFSRKSGKGNVKVITENRERETTNTFWEWQRKMASPRRAARAVFAPFRVFLAATTRSSASTDRADTGSCRAEAFFSFLIPASFCLSLQNQARQCSFCSAPVLEVLLKCPRPARLQEDSGPHFYKQQGAVGRPLVHRQS